MLIVDARSYATAVANRARGGGCEFPQYYPQCDIEFMNLANIHAVRKSFILLRSLCQTAANTQPAADQSKYVTLCFLFVFFRLTESYLVWLYISSEAPYELVVAPKNKKFQLFM